MRVGRMNTNYPNITAVNYWNDVAVLCACRNALMDSVNAVGLVLDPGVRAATAVAFVDCPGSKPCPAMN